MPWIALLTVWIVWGSTYLGIRVAVQTIPPFLMAGTRYLVAGALLYAILFATNRTKHGWPTREAWKSLIIRGFALLVVGNGFVSFAEQQLASSVAALLVATVPMFMIVIEAISAKKKIAGWSIAGLAAGTLGIVMLVGLPGGALPIVPSLLIIVAALSWAAGSVYARHHADGEMSPFQPALEMLIGGAGLLVVGLAAGELRRFSFGNVSHLSLLGMAWLIGPGAMLGYSAYAYAVRTLPTGIVSTYAYINPVVAVILGAWLASEGLTRNVLIGGLAIILSVVAIIAGGRQTRVRESCAAR
ncbi:MAG: EamA family transporter [Candidatus Baltobacteraceae bacterium]